MYKVLVLVGVLTVATFVHGSSEGIDFGHGFQTISKVIRRFLNSQPEDLKLSQGVHLINVRSDNEARAVRDDGSIMSAVENYLQNHELRIKLPELMPGEGFGRAFKEAMTEYEGNSNGTPRGSGNKGNKGGGGVSHMIMLGLMMGKMMATMGMGGVGMLAMKALMVSTLALVLSAVIGLKKLLSTDNDESGHTVIHASAGGHEHRRKRQTAANMAYHGWNENYQTS